MEKTCYHYQDFHQFQEYHYRLFYLEQKLEELIKNTKQVAAKVIELKGATVHAPGNAISAIVESVVRDRKQVIPVATYLDGEYGHSDVTIGVPAVIGNKE